MVKSLRANSILKGDDEPKNKPHIIDRYIGINLPLRLPWVGFADPGD
jgi:hypothetical protein